MKRKTLKILFAVSAVMILMTSCSKREFHETKTFVIVSESSEAASDSTETETEIHTKASAKTSEKESSETPKGSTDPVRESSKTVYITKTGKRYHYNKSCGGDKCFECTLEEALERGLTPCKKCVKEDDQ